MRVERPLVFLIHGFRGHPEEFSPLTTALESEGYETYRVCLPQHGDEPGDLGLVSWIDMLAHCQQELNDFAESGREIHLVGFSLGGVLSLVLNRHNPNIFQSITLVATPARSVFNLEYGQTHLKNFFNRFLPGKQYHIWDTGLPQPRFQPLALLRFYREMEMLFREVQQAAQFVTTPTLLLHSPYDWTVPYNHSEWLYNAIPAETNFVTLLEGGHQIFPFYAKGIVEQSVIQHLQANALLARELAVSHSA